MTARTQARGENHVVPKEYARIKVVDGAEKALQWLTTARVKFGRRLRRTGSHL